MEKYLSIQIMISLLALSIFGSSCAEQKNPVSAQINNAENSEKALTESDSKNSKIPKPEIVSRKDWQATEPIGKGKEHTIKFITIHHTASPQNANISIEKKLQNLQNFSQSESKLADGRTKAAWIDIPYHFYIAVDGKIGEGREIKFVGDTNTDYDPTGHALIVLEGNFEEEIPSAKQIESMENLTAWLADLYKIPASEIKAHDDYTSTACPGKNLKTLLPEIRKKVEQQIWESKTKPKVNKADSINKDSFECVRSIPEPIIKESVFPNKTFKLVKNKEFPYQEIGLETIEFANGDKLTIENTGCESYTLIFHFETSRFSGKPDNVIFWYKTAVQLIEQTKKGLDDETNRITNGIKALKMYINKNQTLKYDEEIDFGGTEIRDIVMLSKVKKLQDKRFKVELSFSTGPL